MVEEDKIELFCTKCIKFDVSVWLAGSRESGCKCKPFTHVFIHTDVVVT